MKIISVYQKNIALTIVMRVGSRPLNVEIILFCHFQSVRDEIVFDGGKNLNDVAAFTTNVQVDHLSIVWNYEYKNSLK